MPQVVSVITTRRSLTRAQIGFRRDAQTMFLRTAGAINGHIIRSATAEGDIPQGQHRAILRLAGEEIDRLFVGPDGRNAFAEDETTPLSPFASRLTFWLMAASLGAVLRHQRWLQNNVPEDVFDWLRAATRRVIVASDALTEQEEGDLSPHLVGPLFRSNPLAALDPDRRWVPFLRWTDPNGYRLSDRIWRTDQETRRKIDLFLAEALRAGEGALPLSRRLEQFLVPGRAKLRTRRPYGTDASFDAMRLGRTEITAAHSRAAFTAAYLNPYVSGIDVARSRNGDPTCPICPLHATIGLSGERLRPPYSTQSTVFPPFHPHCMCVILPVTADDTAVVTERLRGFIASGQAPPPAVNPANAWSFTEMLLGIGLLSLFERELRQLFEEG